MTTEEKPISNLISASSLGPLAKKQDMIAEILVQDENLEKLTELVKDEPLAFAHVNWMLKTWEKMSKAKTVAELEIIPLESIIQDIERFRVSKNRRGREELTNVAKINITTEDTKKKKKRGIFGFMRNEE